MKLNEQIILLAYGYLEKLESGEPTVPPATPSLRRNNKLYAGFLLCKIPSQCNLLLNKEGFKGNQWFPLFELLFYFIYFSINITLCLQIISG